MDSSTGGTLLPVVTPATGPALRLVIQALLAGLLDLPGNLVRQNWQVDVPPVPAIDVNWCGFGLTVTREDANPYVAQVSNTASELQRHEEFEVLCSCYGPACEEYAGRIRDGMAIAQNQETLMLAGMACIGVQGPRHVPELIQDRYQDRADVTIVFRREVRRTYNVFVFVGVTDTIVTDHLVPLTRTGVVSA